MAKTVTLRIDDKLLERFKVHAEEENRTLSNFIETAALRYVENVELIDEFEMQEILSNAHLLKSLRKGSEDAKNKRGQFVKV
jgi:antitoxin component of RelBE/YafQ-DinJ toxin-antitoxin module